MPMTESILQILSRQTTSDNFDCAECLGVGEQLVFDPENGQDYALCEACQGSGYNTLGLIVNGLLQPPEEGLGPQELKAALGLASQQSAELPPPMALFPHAQPKAGKKPVGKPARRLSVRQHPPAAHLKRIS